MPLSTRTPAPFGLDVAADGAELGPVVAGRVLAVDARLDRPAVDGRSPPAPTAACSPCGDADLPLDQVEAGDHLGDRMLDLQPRVHLEEVGHASAPRRRRGRTRPCRASRSRSPGRASARRRTASRAPPAAGAAPAPPRSPSGSCAGSSTRARTDGPDCRGGRRRSAPRDGAAAVISLSISTRSSPKARLRSPGEPAQAAAGNPRPVVDPAHALAAAAGAGLDQQRNADVARLRRASASRILVVAVIAGHARARRRAAAMRLDSIFEPIRSMQPRRAARSRRCRAAAQRRDQLEAFGQEAVAGVDRAGAGSRSQPR